MCFVCLFLLERGEKEDRSGATLGLGEVAGVVSAVVDCASCNEDWVNN